MADEKTPEEVDEQIVDSADQKPYRRKGHRFPQQPVDDEDHSLDNHPDRPRIGVISY